jgi:hypothetical protein
MFVSFIDNAHVPLEAQPKVDLASKGIAFMSNLLKA